MHPLFKSFLGLLATTGLVAQSAFAMTVQPVVLDLQVTGRGGSQVVTVENTFATPLPVEIRTQELDLTPDGLKPNGKDGSDLLVFPPQALIQPGQTQTFRVQYVGDPALAQSKHYYITVAQLPVKLPAGQSAIQILYNFQVLVSVAPNGGKPALKVTSAEITKGANGKPMPVVTVQNDAATYGYLSKGRLRIVERDASGKEVFRRTLTGAEIQQTVGFGLVGSAQSRKVPIPVELPLAEGSVTGEFTPD